MKTVAKKVERKKKAKRTFVFIVDSYEDGTLRKALEDLGLNREENFHITGAGGADSIMMNYGGRRIVDAEKLLVIMSTFHGSVEPAIELCKEIKAANPKVRMIFRSCTSRPSDPMFEQCIDKSNEDDQKLIEIFRKFVGKMVVKPTTVK